MRLALTLLLTLHGLIHLLGVAKAWGLAPVPQLSGAALFGQPYGRLGGLLWLAAALACLVAAGLVLAGRPAWPAITGAVLLSQGLVLAAWPDAKAGTLPNAVLALVAIAGFAMGRFRHESERLFAELAADAPAAGPAVTEADLGALPPPVGRWLRRAGVVGQPLPRVVRLAQGGALRTAPGGDLRPVVARQIFQADRPAFAWTVELAMAGLPVLGRDTYIGDQGRMHITVAGLVPMVDAADAHVDQGARLRFLGELVWLPGAALRPYVQWAPLDAERAVACLHTGPEPVCATFTFDAAGRFVRLEADRSYGGGEGARRVPWVVEATAWKALNAFEIPVEGVVRWRLPEGEFTFFEWRIEAVAYDAPLP